MMSDHFHGNTVISKDFDIMTKNFLNHSDERKQLKMYFHLKKHLYSNLLVLTGNVDLLFLTCVSLSSVRLMLRSLRSAHVEIKVLQFQVKRTYSFLLCMSSPGEYVRFLF